MEPFIAGQAPVRLCGVWCAAHLNEADQDLVVISQLEPTLADRDKKAIFRVLIDDEPLCKS